LPENAYGNVVEAAFKQAVGRRGGRIVALKNTALTARPWAERGAGARPGRCALYRDDGRSVVSVADALTAAGANLRNIQLLGTGLWDNPRVYASPALQGGLYAAPDPAGFRSFSARYRAKFGLIRCAPRRWPMTVALVAALARRKAATVLAEVLTNPSGFAGIDGCFVPRRRYHERGLAVMKGRDGRQRAGRRFPRVLAP